MSSDGADPSWRGGSGAMFDTIAGRYDLLNALTSFGLDRGWRRRLVAQVRDVAGGADDEVLDVATGTGDVALTLVARAAPARVVGLDPSPQMLRLAADKAAHRALSPRLTWVQGEAENLPFADHRFAASCVSFGIRNVPDRLAGLREMARVTRAGGRVCVLELGEPRGRLLGTLARFHVHRVVPWLGGLLSGGGAYRYLERSIAAFPPAEDFVDTMQLAGLVRVRHWPLTFGAVNLFVGDVK